jgi:gliding motility-associated-like protein
MEKPIFYQTKPTYMKKLYFFLSFLFLIFFSQFSQGQIGIHSDVHLSDQSIVGFLSPQLHFQNGVVQSPNGEATIYFSPNLDWEGASDSSHISTYIAVDNHGNLIFPLGDGQGLHPLAIHNAANNAVKTAYIDQQAFGNQLEEGLERLAPFHWKIEGNSPVQISLTWNALSNISQLTNELSALTFVGYNGSVWESIPATVAALDLLNQGASSLIVGSIQSNDVIDLSVYSHLSLAGKEVVTDLFISEAFTPNGDGINDVWYLRNAARYPQMEIRVYNRWGAEVFSTTNGYDNNWNGVYKDQSDPLPSSSYFYQIDLEADGEIDFQGWVFINY